MIISYPLDYDLDGLKHIFLQLVISVLTWAARKTFLIKIKIGT